MRVVIAHAQFKNGMQDWLSLEVFDQLKNATFYHLIRLFVIIPIQLLLMKNSWNVPREFVILAKAPVLYIKMIPKQFESFNI